MYLNEKSDCSPCAVKRKPAPVFKLGEVVESVNGDVFRVNVIMQRHGEIVYGFVSSRTYHNLSLETLPLFNGHDLRKFGSKK